MRLDVLLVAGLFVVMTILSITAIMIVDEWPVGVGHPWFYLAVFGLGMIALLVSVVTFAIHPAVQRYVQDANRQQNAAIGAGALIGDKSSQAQRVSLFDMPAADERTWPSAQHLTRRPVNEATTAIDHQQILEHIEQIVFKIDANGDLVFLSPSWEQLLDHAIADTLNQPLIGFMHPEDRPGVEAQIGGLISGKRNSCQMEARMIARDGTSYWLEVRAKGVNEKHRSVIGTLTNISRQKQVEAGLRAVRRSLNTLLNSIPGMVYRCKGNRNWSFEFASDGCAEVTGYEPYQLVNDPNFYFQQIMFPDDRDYAWNHVNQQVMLHRNFQLVYRIINRSGRVKWVLEQGRGVYSSGGELLALEGFVTVVAEDGERTKAVLEQFYNLISSADVLPR